MLPAKKKKKKLWEDKASEFHNKSMKSCQEKNNVEIHLTYNEGKSVFAERFIRTLKNKVYKYLTSIFKKMCIDKLDITSNNYNNIYHSTIKIKLVDLNSSAYIYFDKKEQRRS